MTRILLEDGDEWPLTEEQATVLEAHEIAYACEECSSDTQTVYHTDAGFDMEHADEPVARAAIARADEIIALRREKP